MKIQQRFIAKLKKFGVDTNLDNATEKGDELFQSRPTD